MKNIAKIIPFAVLLFLGSCKSLTIIDKEHNQSKHIYFRSFECKDDTVKIVTQKGTKLNFKNDFDIRF